MFAVKYRKFVCKSEDADIEPSFNPLMERFKPGAMLWMSRESDFALFIRRHIFLIAASILFSFITINLQKMPGLGEEAVHEVWTDFSIEVNDAGLLATDL